MPDFFDFMTGGSDDLLHSHECPQCKAWFHEDEAVWVNQAQRLAECPNCHQTIQIPDD